MNKAQQHMVGRPRAATIGSVVTIHRSGRHMNRQGTVYATPDADHASVDVRGDLITLRNDELEPKA